MKVSQQAQEQGQLERKLNYFCAVSFLDSGFIAKGTQVRTYLVRRFSICIRLFQMFNINFQ